MDEPTNKNAERLLKIGFDGAALANRRGFGRFARGILSGLAATNPGFELHVVIDEPSSDAVKLPESVQKQVVPLSRSQAQAASAKGNRSGNELWAMSRAVAAMGFDLYYFPSSFTYFPLMPWQKSIVTFHDTLAVDRPDLVFPTRQGRWFWWMKEQAARWNTSRMTTVSATSRRDLARFFHTSESAIGLLTEGVDPVFLSDESQLPNYTELLTTFGLQPSEPYWLYVGGLSPHKNLLRLVEAFASLPPESGKLLLVGDFSDNFHTHVPEIRAKIEAEGLSDRLLLTGFVPDDRLAVIYRHAKGVVLPSLWEGFGLPAAEAMASGTAVLHSTAGSLPEVVGDAGLSFDPLDVNDLSQKWLSLIHNEKLRIKLANRGRERSQQFRWEVAGRMLWQEIEQTSAPKRHGSRWAG
jgi:glycosyltransferase involved in cell wall biosynthesis